jgi:transposase
MNTVAVVAMDIHKKFSKVVALDGDAAVLDEWRVDHGDREVMEEFFRHFEPGTDVVMEATFNWPWIADAAEAMGMSGHLAHAKRAREMAKGMAKSDRKDAVFLGKLFLAGGNVFPDAYLAPPEVRRRRSFFRQRLLLVRVRVAIKNSVHGQLFRVGVVIDEEASDLFSPKGRGILGGLDLDAHERSLLERKLTVVDELTRHIDAMERVLKKEIADDPAAEILMSLPGVAHLTAYTWLAEIGEIGRFPNGRALAAYAGVLPLDRESAEKDFGKRTNASCNRYLRWAALEAVGGAVRKSPRMRALYERVKAKHPDKKGKARVAVARELLELAHLLLSRGEPYQERPPARPGSREERSRRESRRPNRASQITLCARPEE